MRLFHRAFGLKRRNTYTGKKDNPPFNKIVMFNKVMNNGPLNGKLLLPE